MILIDTHNQCYNSIKPAIAEIRKVVSLLFLNTKGNDSLMSTRTGDKLRILRQQHSFCLFQRDKVKLLHVVAGRKYKFIFSLRLQPCMQNLNQDLLKC